MITADVTLIDADFFLVLLKKKSAQISRISVYQRFPFFCGNGRHSLKRDCFLPFNRGGENAKSVFDVICQNDWFGKRIIQSTQINGVGLLE